MNRLSYCYLAIYARKMASSEREKLSLSQNNIRILSATDTNELTINEDSDNDNYDPEDFEEVTYLVMEQKVISNLRASLQ